MSPEKSNYPLELIFPQIQNELLGAVLSVKEKYGISFSVLDPLLANCELQVKSCVLSELSGYISSELAKKEEDTESVYKKGVELASKEGSGA